MSMLNCRDALKIYNSAKIEYNPADYNLKDRLIIDSKTMYKSFEYIPCIPSYGLERKLLELIANFIDVKPNSLTFNDMLESKMLTSISKTGCTFQYVKIGSEIEEAIPNQIPILKHNLLYFNIDKFIRNYKTLFSDTALDNKYMQEKFLKQLVYLCVALESNNSITNELEFLFTNYADENYLDLKMFKIYDCFKNNDRDSISKSSILNTEEDWAFAIIPSDSSGTFSWADVTGLTTTDVNIIATINRTAEISALKTVAYSLELFHIIETLPNSSYRDFLIDYIVSDMNSKSKPQIVQTYIVKSYDSGFKITYYDEVKDIIFENNNATRYNKIKNYIYANAETIISSKHLPPVGYVIGSFIQYMECLSLKNIRINTVITLYDYCKKHDLLKNLKKGTRDALTDTMVDFLKMLGISATSESSKNASRDIASILDSDTMHEHGEASEHVGKKDEMPVYQALDGMITNFKTPMYTFNSVVHVPPTKNTVKYDTIAEAVSKINTDLIRQIREIRTYNTGGKEGGQLKGKLDRKNLYKYKTDKHIFYNNNYKIRENDLAFGIILDISGSMSGDGIRNGITTLITLHEALKTLNINHSIMTHQCEGASYSCDIEVYQSFKEDKNYTSQRNTSIADIKAKYGNCDSAALWFMEKAFERVRNRDKICIMFSDGAPTECTGNDLRKQIEHMENRGIKVIGVGIGYPSIRDYYKEYANGNNLKDMLDIVTNILKEHVLSKLDD